MGRLRRAPPSKRDHERRADALRYIIVSHILPKSGSDEAVWLANLIY